MAIEWQIALLCFGSMGLCNGSPMDLPVLNNDLDSQLIGILVAVMISICAVIAFIGCICCQRRHASGFKEFRDSAVTVSVVNDPGHVNPIASSEFIIFTPLSPPEIQQHHNNNIFRQQTASFIENETLAEPIINKYCVGGLNVSSWFDESESDFPRTKLKYIRELGTGWFGRVVEGAAQNQQGDFQSVAVRILETSATVHEQALFLHEANMYRLPEHPYLLRLLGRSLESTPFLLIQEYCSKGNLKQFLLENRSSANVLFELPLQLCCQLTSALHHLHDNNMPHLDLAARNCQIASNMCLKLGDYGLSVYQYPNDYYQGTPAIPVRWCAPESVHHTHTTLQPAQVTCASNIWSLGVTMWEVCEWGAQPYETLTDDEVVSRVMDSPHLRLPSPTSIVASSSYIQSLYRVMQLCWQPAEKRPLINQIHAMLSHVQQTHRNEPEDFSSRWDSFKPNTIVKTDNYYHPLADLEVEVETLPTGVKSASLTNLHGSLENLMEMETGMESWLENVATDTGDMQFVRGLSEAIHQLDSALETEQTSSSSETEDETWRKRVERGVYSEKVRQKSKSVADLMILTHIECSDTESETPFPSLEYNTMKNIRTSLFSGSEGNLLSVQDTFQEELRKLQEERKDSLLFVPAVNSRMECDNNNCDKILDLSISTQERESNKQIFDQNLELVNSNNNNNLEIEHVQEEMISEIKNERAEKGDECNTLENTETQHIRNDLINEFLLQEIEASSANQYNINSFVKNESEFIVKSILENMIEHLDFNNEQNNSTTTLAPYIEPIGHVYNVFNVSVDHHQTNPLSSVFIKPPLLINGFNKEFNNKSNDYQTVILGPCDDYSLDFYTGLKTTFVVDLDDRPEEELLQFSSNFMCDHEMNTEIATTSSPAPGSEPVVDLDTWDNFLGNALEHQQQDRNNSLEEFVDKNDDNEKVVLNNWEPGEGWFLHSQTQPEDLTGQIDNISDTGGGGGGGGGNDNSYVGFTLDEECMNALRSELEAKLPQAQGLAQEEQELETDEWDSNELDRNEVLVKYNVYGSLLSPIPEETSSGDDLLCDPTPQHRNVSSGSESEWSEPYLPDPEMELGEDDVLAVDTDTHTANILDSPAHTQHNTPSQDSCCSNDTLFNLEDLNCIELNAMCTKNEEAEEEEEKESNLVDNETIASDLYSNHLTDIRFSGPGPGDNVDALQFMSTSFSESTDNVEEERDWDSGSDTKSSSSGEFIWKEGENEESLRTLHATSNDTMIVPENLNLMRTIQEVNSSDGDEDEEEEEDDNEDDECEDDAEETEFVPSAWDAQATPTKSALRSPEKSTNKRKIQQKGVSFKKQKYHCVYEYPREPESPVTPSATDIWRPLSDFSTFTDWELASDENVRNQILYQMNEFPDYNPNVREDNFYISSSARPFQTLNQSSSQFFPGGSQNAEAIKSLWPHQQQQQQNVNITPDSGVEDVTPASDLPLIGIAPMTSVIPLPVRPQVQTLKSLASLAVAKRNDSSLGGLRHTRNRLKLDLPPSPSSFTASRTFTLDLNTNEPVISREVPAFTTFGKSRFLVQHVHTPTTTSDEGEDASIEEKERMKPRGDEGEASLLDSADEDSGIESSANATLERHHQPSILNH